MFDWIINALEKAGAAGVMLLMLLENLLPPIPSEVIMPLAGFVASRGEESLTLVIIAGSIGSLLGTTAWYVLGRKLGHVRLIAFASRHGRWITMTPKDIVAATAWFERYGTWALVLGRLVPGVRTFISVPAGIARMPLSTFLLYSALGTVLWTATLAVAGYWLGQDYKAVAGFIEPISNVVIIVVAAIYLYRVATFKGDEVKGG